MSLCPSSERVEFTRQKNGRLKARVVPHGLMVRPRYEEYMAAVPVSPLPTIFFESRDVMRGVWLQDKSFARQCRNDLELAMKICKAYPALYRVVIREFRGEELVREYLVNAQNAKAVKLSGMIPRDVIKARKNRKRAY